MAKVENIKSLRDYISCRNQTVFYGVQYGGSLKTSISVPIRPQTPCIAQFNRLYTRTFENPTYLTIVPLKNVGPNVYGIQLDEASDNTKTQWFRQIGSAALVSDNELAINETDGVFGRLTLLPTGELILYRTRLGYDAEGDFNPFDQRGYMEFSSRKCRNREVPCCDK